MAPSQAIEPSSGHFSLLSCESLGQRYVRSSFNSQSPAGPAAGPAGMSWRCWAESPPARAPASRAGAGPAPHAPGGILGAEPLLQGLPLAPASFSSALRGRSGAGPFQLGGCAALWCWPLRPQSAGEAEGPGPGQAGHPGQQRSQGPRLNGTGGSTASYSGTGRGPDPPPSLTGCWEGPTPVLQMKTLSSRGPAEWGLQTRLGRREELTLGWEGRPCAQRGKFLP